MSRHIDLDKGVPNFSVFTVALFSFGFNDLVTLIPTNIKFFLYEDNLDFYSWG